MLRNTRMHTRPEALLLKSSGNRTTTPSKQDCRGEKRTQWRRAEERRSGSNRSKQKKNEEEEEEKDETLLRTSTDRVRPREQRASRAGKVGRTGQRTERCNSRGGDGKGRTGESGERAEIGQIPGARESGQHSLHHASAFATRRALSVEEGTTEQTTPHWWLQRRCAPR